jgi:hypothetical protein
MLRLSVPAFSGSYAKNRRKRDFTRVLVTLKRLKKAKKGMIRHIIEQQNAGRTLPAIPFFRESGQFESAELDKNAVLAAS